MHGDRPPLATRSPDDGVGGALAAIGNRHTNALAGPKHLPGSLPQQIGRIVAGQ